MSEENTEPTPTETPAPDETAEPISNRDIKSNPVFQKLTAELSQYKQREAEREQQKADSIAKAEQEALIAKGDFEAALKMRDEQLASEKTKFESELLKRDLKAELYNAGFKNDMFVNGAIGTYNGDSDGVKDFVAQLASDESNAALLGAVAPKREVLDPSGKLSISSGSMSEEKIRQIAKTGATPEIRSEARMALLKLIESG